MGDFVTLHKFRLDKQTGKIIRDRGVGWAWLGFLNARQTPFYTCHTEISPAKSIPRSWA